MKKVILLVCLFVYGSVFSSTFRTFLIEENAATFAYPEIVGQENKNLILSYIKKQGNYSNLYLVVFSPEKGVQHEKFLPSSIKNKNYYTFGFIPYVILKNSDGSFYKVEVLVDGGIYFHRFSFSDTDFSEILIDKARKYHCCHCPSMISTDGKLFLVYLKENAVWFTKYEKGKWKRPRVIIGTESKSNSEYKMNMEIRWAQPYLASLKKNLFLFIDGKLFYSGNEGERWRIIKRKFGRKSISNKYNRLISDNERMYFFWIKKKVLKQEVPVFVEGFEEGYCEIRITSSRNGIFWFPSKIINDEKLLYRIKIGGIYTPTKEILLKDAMQPEILDVKFSSDKKILGFLWKDWRDKIPKIYFAYSQDKGRTWSENLCVVSSKNVNEASVSIANEKLYIFWSKKEEIEKGKYKTFLYLTEIYFGDKIKKK